MNREPSDFGLLKEREAPGRKWLYVPALLLLVVAVCIGIILINRVGGTQAILAAMGKETGTGQAQAAPNQPPAEANEPAEQKPAEPNDPNDKKPLRPTHKHTAFGERIKERARMVSRQIEAR
ncbi:MAG: hypothetical protein ACYSUD_20250, partial [Planctomycetota bacterium]